MTTPARSDRLARCLWLAALALVFLLSGCGGGGGDGVGSGGTGSYAAGPISGFGSVIVNGIRYDDDDAQVLDEDGNPVPNEVLRLGMVVEVNGSALSASPSGPTATASTIRFASEIVGPVQALDATAGTLRVLGQEVEVTATTVFEDEIAGGLTDVDLGDVLEVHALGNGAGRYIATRIERRGGTVVEYRLRGPVQALDTAARTFRIGATTIDYGDIRPTPALAEGRFVRVRLETVPVDGAYVATRLRGAGRQVEDRDEAEVEGVVSRAEPGGLRFTVEGIPVDASSAAFDDGAASDIAVGVRVEVEGRIEDGVLIAGEVELEDRDGRRGDDDDDGDDEGIELEGPVASLDADSFVLRGFTVLYAGAGFEGGGVARLANGVSVEVEGRLAPDGVTVEATKIEFED